MVDMDRFSDAPDAPPFEDPDPPRPPDAAWSRALAQALDPSATVAGNVLPADTGEPAGDDVPLEAGDPSSEDVGAAWDASDLPEPGSGPLDAPDDPPASWDDDAW